MGLHITRGIAATLNFALGALLTYLWFLLAREGGFGSGGAGQWILIAAMVVMTITCMLSAAFLSLRRTLTQGVKWNAAVAFCWLVGAFGGIIASLQDGNFDLSDAGAVAFLGGIGMAWLFLGWAVGRFQNLESRQLTALGQSVETSVIVPRHAVPVEAAALASAHVQAEAPAPLVLGRRN